MREVAIVYNKSGTIRMVVIPTGSTSLDDPAFNPPDCVQTRISYDDYLALRPEQGYNRLPLLKASATDLLAKDPELATLVSQKISTLETEILVKEAALLAEAEAKK